MRPTVLGSRVCLRRALDNLLENARQHTPAGSQIEVTLDVDYQSTILMVRDEGPAVPASLRERVFEPFYTTREVGNGLGLAVVRMVAQAHGGTVRFLDGPGGTVRLAIPHQRVLNGLSLQGVP